MCISVRVSCSLWYRVDMDTSMSNASSVFLRLHIKLPSSDVFSNRAHFDALKASGSFAFLSFPTTSIYLVVVVTSLVPPCFTRLPFSARYLAHRFIPVTTTMPLVPVNLCDRWVSAIDGYSLRKANPTVHVLRYTEDAIRLRAQLILPWNIQFSFCV